MWKKQKTCHKHELSSSALELIQRYTKIRDPFGYCEHSIKLNPIYSFFKEQLKKLRISKKPTRSPYDYYRNTIDYLNDSGTILLGKKMRDNYWDKYDPNNKRRGH